MLSKGILAAALICSAMLAVESGRAAAPEVRKLDSSDLSIVIGAYVDSVVELRQLLLACAQTEPLHWDEASALLGATLRAAGFGESETAALTARLAVGRQGSAPYECGSELVATRLSMDPPSDWVELHKAALADIGIAIVTPDPPADARLEAVRTRFRRSSAGTGAHAALHGAGPAALVSDGLRRLGSLVDKATRGPARGRLFGAKSSHPSSTPRVPRDC